MGLLVVGMSGSGLHGQETTSGLLARLALLWSGVTSHRRHCAYLTVEPGMGLSVIPGLLRQIQDMDILEHLAAIPAPHDDQPVKRRAVGGDGVQEAAVIESRGGGWACQRGLLPLARGPCLVQLQDPQLS